MQQHRQPLWLFFVLGGLFLLSLTIALAEGSQRVWLLVGALAFVLAFTLWRQDQPTR